MGLQKEYVITEIKASPEGAPHVFVSLRSPEDVAGPRTQSVSSVATFSSMEDMLKNLGHVISKQIIGGFATVLKLSLNEYEKLDIKVGDRISVDINKIQIGIP